MGSNVSDTSMGFGGDVMDCWTVFGMWLGTGTEVIAIGVIRRFPPRTRVSACAAMILGSAGGVGPFLRTCSAAAMTCAGRELERGLDGLVEGGSVAVAVADGFLGVEILLEVGNWEIVGLGVAVVGGGSLATISIVSSTNEV